MREFVFFKYLKKIFWLIFCINIQIFSAPLYQKPVAVPLSISPSFKIGSASLIAQINANYISNPSLVYPILVFSNNSVWTKIPGGLAPKPGSYDKWAPTVFSSTDSAIFINLVRQYPSTHYKQPVITQTINQFINNVLIVAQIVVQTLEVSSKAITFFVGVDKKVYQGSAVVASDYVSWCNTSFYVSDANAIKTKVATYFPPNFKLTDSSGGISPTTLFNTGVGPAIAQINALSLYNVAVVFYIAANGSVYSADNPNVPLNSDYVTWITTNFSAGDVTIIKTSIANLLTKYRTTNLTKPSLVTPLTSQIIINDTTQALAQFTAEDLDTPPHVLTFLIGSDNKVYQQGQFSQGSVDLATFFTQADVNTINSSINNVVTPLIRAYQTSRFVSPSGFAAPSQPTAIESVQMIAQFTANDLSTPPNVVTFFVGVDGNVYKSGQTTPVTLAAAFSTADQATITSSIAPMIRAYQTSRFVSPSGFAAPNQPTSIGSVQMVAQFTANDLSTPPNQVTFYAGVDGNVYKSGQTTPVTLAAAFSTADQAAITSSISPMIRAYQTSRFVSPSGFATPNQPTAIGSVQIIAQFTANDLSTPPNQVTFYAGVDGNVYKSGQTTPVTLSAAFSTADQATITSSIAPMIRAYQTSRFVSPSGFAAPSQPTAIGSVQMVAQFTANDLSTPPNVVTFFVGVDSNVYKSGQTTPVTLTAAFSTADQATITSSIAPMIRAYQTSRFVSPSGFAAPNQPTSIGSVQMVAQFTANDLSTPPNQVTFYAGVDGNVYKSGQTTPVTLAAAFSTADQATITSSIAPMIRAYQTSRFVSPSGFAASLGVTTIGSTPVVGRFRANDLSTPPNNVEFYLGLDGNAYQFGSPKAGYPASNLTASFSVDGQSVIATFLRDYKNTHFAVTGLSELSQPTLFGSAKMIAQLMVNDLNTPPNPKNFLIGIDGNIYKSGEEGFLNPALIFGATDRENIATFVRNYQTTHFASPTGFAAPSREMWIGASLIIAQFTANDLTSRATSVQFFVDTDSKIYQSGLATPIDPKIFSTEDQKIISDSIYRFLKPYQTSRFVSPSGFAAPNQPTSIGSVQMVAQFTANDLSTPPNQATFYAGVDGNVYKSDQTTPVTLAAAFSTADQATITSSIAAMIRAYQTSRFVSPSGFAAPNQPTSIGSVQMVAQFTANDLSTPPNQATFYAGVDGNVYKSDQTTPVTLAAAFSTADQATITSSIAAMIRAYQTSRFVSPSGFAAPNQPTSIGSVQMVAQFTANDLSTPPNQVTFYAGVDGNVYKSGQTTPVTLSAAFSTADQATITSSIAPMIRAYQTSRFVSPSGFATPNQPTSIGSVQIIAQFTANDLSTPPNQVTFYAGVDGNVYKSGQTTPVTLSAAFSTADQATISASIINFQTTRFTTPSSVVRPRQATKINNLNVLGQFTAKNFVPNSSAVTFYLCNDGKYYQAGQTSFVNLSSIFSASDVTSILTSAAPILRSNFISPTNFVVPSQSTINGASLIAQFTASDLNTPPNQVTFFVSIDGSLYLSGQTSPMNILSVFPASDQSTIATGLADFMKNNAGSTYATATISQIGGQFFAVSSTNSSQLSSDIALSVLCSVSVWNPQIGREDYYVDAAGMIYRGRWSQQGGATYVSPEDIQPYTLWLQRKSNTSTLYFLPSYQKYYALQISRIIGSPERSLFTQINNANGALSISPTTITSTGYTDLLGNSVSSLSKMVVIKINNQDYKFVMSSQGSVYWLLGTSVILMNSILFNSSNNTLGTIS